MKKRRVLILGAAGRDYENFLVFFKDNPQYDVVCFTQAQIPGIEKRSFPKQLAGRLYKKDIPFYREEELEKLIKKFKVDDVVLSYSDLSHQEVMMKASRALAAGASFRLLGPNDTYIQSKKPVIAVTAVRTGAGKSQTSRAIGEILRKAGKKVVVIRHSMPYGKDLTKQTCQRFETEDDFIKHSTTIEEEEEYQPLLDHGFVVYAGFDYKEIVRQAEKEADVLIFDGGNNDISFIQPNLRITVVDPHRAGHELIYYPGLINFLMADILVVNKIDSAQKEEIDHVLSNIQKYSPHAEVVLAKSDLVIKQPRPLLGKNCLAIGDGPTLSHGGMKFGAATLAIQRDGGKLVDPRPYAVGSIAETYKKYPHLQYELPAMGYNKQQIKELEQTINKVPCDIVVDGTPANLQRILNIKKPVIDVRYELGSEASAKLVSILKKRKFI